MCFCTTQKPAIGVGLALFSTVDAASAAALRTSLGVKETFELLEVVTVQPLNDFFIAGGRMIISSGKQSHYIYLVPSFFRNGL